MIMALKEAFTKTLNKKHKNASAICYKNLCHSMNVNRTKSEEHTPEKSKNDHFDLTLKY